MYVGVLPICACLCTMCVQYLQRSEEGLGSPEIGDTDPCQLPCRYWELNQSPLEEQPVSYNYFN